MGCLKLQHVSKDKRVGVQNQGASRAAPCLEPHRRTQMASSSLIVTSNLCGQKMDSSSSSLHCPVTRIFTLTGYICNDCFQMRPLKIRKDDHCRRHNSIHSTRHTPAARIRSKEHSAPTGSTRHPATFHVSKANSAIPREEQAIHLPVFSECSGVP